MPDSNNSAEFSLPDNPDAERYSLSAFAKMNTFRKHGQLCDIVVKVGGREFPAHRVVLAASSDYFDAMFSSGMAESAQLEVELKSVSPDVMEALLDFMYTGQVCVSMENVQDLLPAASLVQMEGVKTVCSAFLFGEVDASNVLGIRRFAELHSCTELEAFTKNYAAHNFESVIEHEEFLFLTAEELIELLSREDLHVSSEETAYRAVIRWVYEDVDERSSHLPGLLSQLRLATMSVRFLTDVVDSERLIRLSMECRDLVDEAKRFHLRPDLRPQMRDRRFRQRDSGDEYLVVIGGFGSYQSPSDSVEMFNPRTREWSELPNLPISYRYVAACSLGTCVYVIGGFDGGERLNTVGLLDVGQRERGWRWLTPMHYKRGLSAACTHQGLIYVCGGFDGQTRLRALEVYHPKIAEWRILEEMSTAREGAGLVVADDCLYCLGGYDGFQLLNSMEAYDLRRGTWSMCKPMYMRRSGAGCAVLGDNIYVCGGYGGAEGRGPLHLDTVESFNTRLCQWTLVSSMNVPRCYVGACQLAGRIYVAAGYNGNRLLNTVEAFDPIDNTWTLYEENRMHNERCDTGMCVVRFPSHSEHNSLPSTSNAISGPSRHVGASSGSYAPRPVHPEQTPRPGRASDSTGTIMPSAAPRITATPTTGTSATTTGRLRPAAFRQAPTVPIHPVERSDDSQTQVQVVTPLCQSTTTAVSEARPLPGSSQANGNGGDIAAAAPPPLPSTSRMAAPRRTISSAHTVSRLMFESCSAGGGPPVALHSSHRLRMPPPPPPSLLNVNDGGGSAPTPTVSLLDPPPQRLQRGRPTRFMRPSNHPGTAGQEQVLLEEEEEEDEEAEEGEDDDALVREDAVERGGPQYRRLPVFTERLLTDEVVSLLDGSENGYSLGALREFSGRVLPTRTPLEAVNQRPSRHSTNSAPDYLALVDAHNPLRASSDAVGQDADLVSTASADHQVVSAPTALTYADLEGSSLAAPVSITVLPYSPSDQLDQTLSAYTYSPANVFLTPAYGPTLNLTETVDFLFDEEGAPSERHADHDVISLPREYSESYLDQALATGISATGLFLDDEEEVDAGVEVEEEEEEEEDDDDDDGEEEGEEEVVVDYEVEDGDAADHRGTFAGGGIGAGDSEDATASSFCPGNEASRLAYLRLEEAGEANEETPVVVSSACPFAREHLLRGEAVPPDNSLLTVDSTPQSSRVAARGSLDAGASSLLPSPSFGDAQISPPDVPIGANGAFSVMPAPARTMRQPQPTLLSVQNPLLHSMVVNSPANSGLWTQRSRRPSNSSHPVVVGTAEDTLEKRSIAVGARSSPSPPPTSAPIPPSEVFNAGDADTASVVSAPDAGLRCEPPRAAEDESVAAGACNGLCDSCLLLLPVTSPRPSVDATQPDARSDGEGEEGDDPSIGGGGGGGSTAFPLVDGQAEEPLPQQQAQPPPHRHHQQLPSLREPVGEAAVPATAVPNPESEAGREREVEADLESQTK